MAEARKAIEGSDYRPQRDTAHEMSHNSSAATYHQKLS